MIKHGVLLAGGNGTRMRPFSNFFNKALVPVNDKFLIDYPIQTLKDAGVSELCVVLGGEHFAQIAAYLKDGADFGMNISYVFQREPLGIAHGINLTKNIIGNNEFITLLGDNFYQKPIHFNNDRGCKIILKSSNELYRFGVASVDRDNREIIKVREKPKPQTLEPQLDHFAITGFYKFDKDFFEFFKLLKPSDRGEYEVVHIIQHYMNNSNLGYSIIDFAWQDCGTFPALELVREHLRKP